MPAISLRSPGWKLRFSSLTAGANCSGVLRDCANGERGKVTCDGVTKYCPNCTCSAGTRCATTGEVISCTGDNTHPGACHIGGSGSGVYIECNGERTYCEP